jgi:serine/threonine-protein kinase HipA
MARGRNVRALAVWMNGERVGDWRLTSGYGHEFLYSETWLSSRHARPISLSLPLRPSREPYRKGVQEFFENLLPDNPAIRERLRRRFNARSTGAFDLLVEIGRDCVGALQIMPEETAPPDIRQITGKRISQREVGKILERTLDSKLGIGASIEDAFRISIAGAQEKTALLRHQGEWMEPSGATPSTYILKLPIGIGGRGIDLSTSVENEWLCAQIANQYGIEVAPCRMETFGEYKVLVVERFDRKLAPDGSWYMRLPQEDFCQATGTAPDLKYESDGGPGIATILELLRGSERAEADRNDFLRTQVLFWMLAAIDGHAKNFSIFHLPGSAYRLTPRYDILSAYPVMGHGRGKLAPEEIRMAMAVSGKNRHYRWNEIHARHWIATARRGGVEGVESIFEDFIGRTPAVVARVQNALPTGFPSKIAEAILAGIQERAFKLKIEMARIR